MLALMFAAALAMEEAGPALTASQDWTEAKDEGLAVSFCYPAGLFKPAKAGKLSDGVQFTAKDGAKLAFWTHEDTETRGLKAARDDLSNEISSAGGRFIKGTNGGSIFEPWTFATFIIHGKMNYHVIQRWNTHVNYMRLSVPLRLSDAYDEVAARMANCFQPIRQNAK